MMRVYLDNCCYNRPFDEQAQLKVRLETEAKLRVQAMMRNGEVEYVWSDILSHEVLDNPFPPRREKILEWRHGAFCTVEMTADAIADADDLAAKGLKAADALHVASAAAADCNYFHFDRHSFVAPYSPVQGDANLESYGVPFGGGRWDMKIMICASRG